MITYNEHVLKHFENPKNVGCFRQHAPNIRTGKIASLGEHLQIQFALDQQQRIEQVKFKANAHPFVIAGLSLMSEWITGQTLTQVSQFNYEQLAKQLGLPSNKQYCIILIENVISAAINDPHA